MALKSIAFFTIIFTTTFAAWSMDNSLWEREYLKGIDVDRIILEPVQKEFIDDVAANLALKCNPNFDPSHDSYATINAFYKTSKKHWDLFRDGWHQVKWDIQGFPDYSMPFEKRTELLARDFDRWRSTAEAIENALRFKAIWNIAGMKDTVQSEGTSGHDILYTKCSAFRALSDDNRKSFKNDLALRGWLNSSAAIIGTLLGIYCIKKMNPEKFIPNVMKFSCGFLLLTQSSSFLYYGLHNLTDRYIYFEKLEKLQKQKINAIYQIMASESLTTDFTPASNDSTI